jgi:RNA-directed DNA polymerase
VSERRTNLRSVPRLGSKPAAKRVRKLCRAISDMNTRRTAWQDPEDLVGRLNRKLRGWPAYFRLGSVSEAYKAVQQHVHRRLRHWLLAKHQAPGRGTKRYPDEYFHATLGLIRLPALTRTFPWANAWATRQ